MASLISGYEYDIFISYRHNDNKSGWVTDFVNGLQEELATTIKEPLTIYFDKNPHDGLLETHSVDKSLEGKLKCLIFIPIISQTYCDPKSFAWQHEFCAFNKLAKEDQFGRDIKLNNGNVASRILPVKIHDLDAEDKSTIENEIGGVLRAIEFIFKSAGVNRPLRAQEDHPQDNLIKTYYRDQINKVANAIKGIITALKSNTDSNKNQVKEAPVQPSKRSRMVIAVTAILITLLVASVYMIYPNLQLLSSKKQATLEKSIAVLPFKNISNDSSQVYFSDGLTIEITDRLTKISGLRVAPTTSMEEYKGTEKRTSQIADELGVSYVLQGDVRKYENNLRITVRLIAAEQNELIWSETLDKPFTEVFKVQGDIASQVASFLQITLTESDKGSLAYIPTRFISAYDFYLRANELSAQRMNENEQSISYLKEAIKIDPQFVEAWATLGFRFSKKARDLDAGKNWNDSAVYYASRALQISPNSDVANRSMGFCLMYKDNLEKANSFLRKADRLNPNSGLALRPLSTVQLSMGRVDSAYYYANKLVRVSPKSGGSSQKLRIFKRLAEWDSCRLYVERSIAPDQSKTGRDMGVLECTAFYIAAGEYNQALILLQENLAGMEGVREQRTYRMAIYALQNDWDSFAKLLDESEPEWAALFYKQTNNKKKFDQTIARLKLENPDSSNLLLLTNDFASLTHKLKAESPDVRFSGYRFWLSNPFAKEFIATPEFKELFAGYEDWKNEMMSNIQKMNQ